MFTQQANDMMKDRYMLEHEKSPLDVFKRVAIAYSDDADHAKRLYKYMRSFWFMPATPILANASRGKGLPISCFLNEAEDTFDSIAKTLNENNYLAYSGGGIGTYWGNVRPVGEKITNAGATAGVIPFLKVMDSATLAVSQGSLRRGSSAAYMPINHIEIEEFIDLRRPTGDQNRRCQNLHHGVIVDDAFMNAVKNNDDYFLKSPHQSGTIKKINARYLWQKILTTRLETGEPYIVYIDNVNKAGNIPDQSRAIKTSNLCSEIFLPTSQTETAVCCLSSVNIEYFEQWKANNLFIKDIATFLDNVLTSFIDKAPAALEKARNFAVKNRSIGLGVMGLHTYAQKNMLLFESDDFLLLQSSFFDHIHIKMNEASGILADQRGRPHYAEKFNLNKRFMHTIAVAPTASISAICNTSPGCDPIVSNIYKHKTLSGEYTAKNKALDEWSKSQDFDYGQFWTDVLNNGGSVQNIDYIDQSVKEVFKTALEIDQMAIIKGAAMRAPFIDQGQSTNIFLKADITKQELHNIHFKAWESGLKSLYYCRSQAIKKAETEKTAQLKQVCAFESCEACQ